MIQCCPAHLHSKHTFKLKFCELKFVILRLITKLMKHGAICYVQSLDRAQSSDLGFVRAICLRARPSITNVVHMHVQSLAPVCWFIILVGEWRIVRPSRSGRKKPSYPERKSEARYSYY